MKTTFRYTILLAINFAILLSCKKDKVSEIPAQKVLIYERISGHYKVYDTNSVFLYEMDLEYIVNNDEGFDSIRFTNFDNDFNYSRLQSSGNNYDYVDSKRIGVYSPFPTKSKNNKSWSIFPAIDSIYDNFWRNDTIKMCFEKHNTPWWLHELVPYVDIKVKQIAVKQH